MAPEQFHDARYVNPTADIYSLGVILFQMLSGHLPYGSRKEGRSLYEVMMGHMSEPVPTLATFNPGIGVGLQAVVEKALAKVPAQRYQSALELLEAFRSAISESEPTQALFLPDAHKPAQLLSVTPSVNPAGSVQAPSTSPLPAAFPATDNSTIALPHSHSVTPEQNLQPPKKNLHSAVLLSDNGKAFATKTRNQPSFSVLVWRIIVIVSVLVLMMVFLNVIKENNPQTGSPNTGVKGNPAGLSGSTDRVPSGTVNGGPTLLAQTPITSLSLQPTPVVGKLQPETIGLPVFPDMHYQEPTAEQLKQYQEIVSSVPNQFNVITTTIAAYTTSASATSLKNFYKTELEKAGWHDVTYLFNLLSVGNVKEIVAELDKGGGFSLVYQKGNVLVSIFGGSEQIAKLLGFSNIAPNEFGLLINAAFTGSGSTTPTP